MLANVRSLLQALAHATIRYGVFKSTRALAYGLAGTQDLDIIVHREDYTHFSQIMAEHGAIRSATNRMLLSPGREDWFLPDYESASYLHFDVHTRIVVGAKFSKTFVAFDYDDISEWVTTGGLPPRVSVLDEARITLSRISFRENGRLFSRTVAPGGDWKTEVSELLFPQGSPDSAQILFPHLGAEVSLNVRRKADGFLLDRAELRTLRQQIISRNGGGWLAHRANYLRSALRGAVYKLTRSFEMVFPGRVLSRRGPVTGGLAVAIIAPDGLGKSTQVARLDKIFSWKFSATKEYLGTGDGDGWLLRRVLYGIYDRRKRKKSKAGQHTESQNSSEKSGNILIVWLRALWGSMVALERYQTVRRVINARNRGFIVICDRWPQSMEAGRMDGPVDLSAHADIPLVRWLGRMEHALYARIDRMPADLMIHMVADHAVSAARKPDEIAKPAYEARIDLMRRLRASDPRIVVIDAAQDIDRVTSQIFQQVWERL